MKLSHRLAQQFRAKLAEAKAITDLAETEDRDLTADEQTRSKALLDEAETLKAQVTEAEAAEKRQAELDAFATQPDRAAPPTQIGDPTRRVPAAHVRSSDQDYSLMRAIASTDPRYRGVDAAFEQRVSDELRERGHAGSRGDVQGILVPMRALLPRAKQYDGIERRDVEKTGTASGAAMIAVELAIDSFIEFLRNRSRCVEAGARVLPGLVGDLDIPRQNATGAAGWLSTETTAATEANLTTQLVSFRPKTVAVRAQITRRMQKQFLAVEDLVRADIAASIGTAVDAGAINGSGASGQPTGVINQAGVGTVVTTPSIVYAEALEFESDLGAANALQGRLAWMTRSSVISVLKSREEVTSSGQGFLMKPDNTMIGYPVLRTEQVPAATLIFGNWEELMIGLWGGLDLFSDPYTDGNSAILNVRGFQDIDVQVRHAVSFTFANDIA